MSSSCRVRSSPMPSMSDYNIEGAAVGYKWFDEKKLEPLFPFGFGLSYSRFGYSDLHVSSQGDRVTVSFKVTNLG